MKNILTFIILFLLTGNTIFSQNYPDKKGFALLELYTSEGCSSCPPADELLGKIQNEYKDDNVYVLAYHVDYWDKQGWKDVFSNADFTKRQYDYAKFMDKAPIYTPQVIINGKADYIGSQETSLRNGIKSAISKSASSNITFETTQNDAKLSINFSIEGTSKNSRLFIAVIQKSAKSNVKRGENAHRVLSHYQIVRQLQSVDLNKAKKGTVSVHLPKNFNKQDFEIIGFVQDMNSGAILGVKCA
ncbi:DUF1223 domain-containing protein [Flavobacterium hydrophilum]|uniref:DUF1223 domain-containing protein n=1 Tax=Flavobacterium hydrophilum TaxID=2211445 RepID=A0A2V4C8G1_9FLAO|nr:DUF1223 domain-containing protein [Flavobacterium hydrophilum]PXY46403.1 DUF1223 domain-containing protein [Flavobacterium hydrophilum]